MPMCLSAQAYLAPLQGGSGEPGAHYQRRAVAHTGRCLPALVRRPDQHQAAVRPRHGAAHEHDVVVGVDLDHVEVADRDAGVAVAAGHADALLGAAAAAVAGVGAEATVLPRALLDAVAQAQALEAVPLHRAGEAAALARADHIDARHVLEDVGGGQDGADGLVGRAVEAELADVALRLDVGLGQDLDAGLLHPLAALGAEVGGDVAALRPDRLAARLVEEADLHRGVAVALRRADLQDRAGPELQDGHGGEVPLVVVDLR